jgi:hypothetical protein
MADLRISRNFLQTMALFQRTIKPPKSPIDGKKTKQSNPF